jgi:hypothetical protein
MAIQITSINKQAYDKWRITIQDTADVVGKDENNNDVYKSYGVSYYPSKGTDDLKNRIEAQISANKKTLSDADKIETDIKTTVESVDSSKVEVA